MKLELLDHRRGRLRDKLINRFTDQERPDLEQVHTALRAARNTEPNATPRTDWRAAEGHKFRQLLLSQAQRLILALKLSKHAHGSLAIQWYLHWIPMRPTAVIEHTETAGRGALKTLAHTLAQPSLTPTEEQALITAIDFITENTTLNNVSRRAWPLWHHNIDIIQHRWSVLRCATDWRTGGAIDARFIEGNSSTTDRSRPSASQPELQDPQSTVTETRL